MTDDTINDGNGKATGVQPDGSNKRTTNARKFSSKSTATEAQYERIDRMLTTGEKNTFQFRRAGIMSPASRIKEMNDRLGYYIPTIDQRDIYDEEGYLHKRVAVYELIDRPKEGRAAI